MFRRHLREEHRAVDDIQEIAVGVATVEDAEVGQASENALPDLCRLRLCERKRARSATSAPAFMPRSSSTRLTTGSTSAEGIRVPSSPMFLQTYL